MIKCDNKINDLFRNKDIPADISLLNLIEHMRDIVIRNVNNPDLAEVQPIDYNVMYVSLYFSQRPIQESIQQPIPINGMLLMTSQGVSRKFILGTTVYPKLTETFAIGEMDGHVIVHHKDVSYIYIDLNGSDVITTYVTRECLSEAVMLGTYSPTNLFNAESGYSTKRRVLKKDHKTIASITKRLVVLNALPQELILKNPAIISELTDYRLFIGELSVIVGDILFHLFRTNKYDISTMLPGTHFDVKECITLLMEYQNQDFLNVYTWTAGNDLGLFQCMLGVMWVNILDLLDQEFIEVCGNNISYSAFLPAAGSGMDHDGDVQAETKQNYS